MLFSWEIACLFNCFFILIILNIKCVFYYSLELLFMKPEYINFNTYSSFSFSYLLKQNINKLQNFVFPPLNSMIITCVSSDF